MLDVGTSPCSRRLLDRFGRTGYLAIDIDPDALIDLGHGFDVLDEQPVGASR